MISTQVPQQRVQKKCDSLHSVSGSYPHTNACFAGPALAGPGTGRLHTGGYLQTRGKAPQSALTELVRQLLYVAAL